MKIIILLTFIFISFIGQATELPAWESPEHNAEQLAKINYELKDQKRFRIENILKQSIFNTMPENLAEGQINNYDPMLVTIASALKSQTYERNNEEWVKAALPPINPEVSAICPEALTAYIKNTNSPHTFVVLPGTHAGWKSGAFLNQTAFTLKEQFNDPNIIYISGYLSEEFLADSCKKIPWDLVSIAEDLYLRIRKLLNSRQADPQKTGLIGWSGGGGLTLVMLGMDSKFQQQTFQNGGIAFSPTLDGRVTFSNLDQAYLLSSLKTPYELASLDWENLKFFIPALFEDGAIDWKDMINMYEKNPENFIARSFNHFTLDNLQSTMEAVNVNEEDLNGGLSHYNFYVNTGFRQDMRANFQNLEELNTYFDDYLNPRPYLENIKQLFLIHFSQDDPVLSSYNNSGQPEVITNILNTAQQNPNIIVSNPPYGGHTSQGLDPIFDELIKEFFTD